MTVKQFLKSKTFKCIIVLLAIALVAGGLLAILNDVLYISPEEQLQNAISKIYGTQIGYEVVNVEAADATNEYGTVDSVYSLEDGNYLIKATGINGYKNGTVTVWLVAGFSDGNFNGINSVTLESYEKQTAMTSLTSQFLNAYANIENNDDVLSGDYFSTTFGEDDIQNVTSGATKSSNAYNNAVNASLYYIRNVLVNGGQL